MPSVRACGGDGRIAERTFGDHLDDIGSPRTPRLREHALCRQPHAKFPIARQREAGAQEGFEACLGRNGVLVVLSGAHELDPVSALAEGRDHHADRAGDAVDLGRVGLGNDGDVKLAPGAFGSHPGDSGCGV